MRDVRPENNPNQSNPETKVLNLKTGESNAGNGGRRGEREEVETLCEAYSGV